MSSLRTSRASALGSMAPVSPSTALMEAGRGVSLSETKDILGVGLGRKGGAGREMVRERSVEPRAFKAIGVGSGSR